MVAPTLHTLKSLRTDHNFDLFSQKVMALANKFDVDAPSLPRKRKAPRCLDEGSAPTFHGTVEKHYRVIFFEAIDLITSAIDRRFQQPGYETYGKVQSLLLKAASAQEYGEELRFVLSFYGSDFDPHLLQTHLDIFSRPFQVEGDVTVSDIVTFFQKCTSGQLELISEVMKLVILLLVMPTTNAASERSFSAMRLIKTYLRSTMYQQHLNHLMLMHIHKDQTDALNLVDVANDFIAGSNHRKDVFGTEFKPTDLL